MDNASVGRVTVGEGRQLRLARNLIRRYEKASGERKAKLHKRYLWAVGHLTAHTLRQG